MHGYGTAKNDKHAWLTRSGSRSTVPSPRGHFFDLVAPENFEELPLNQQRNIVAKQFELGCEKLKALKAEAKTTKLSRRQYDGMRAELIERNTFWSVKLQEINRQISLTGAPPFTKVFFAVAKELLPTNLYRQVLEAAQSKLEEIQIARQAGDFDPNENSSGFRK